VGRPKRRWNEKVEREVKGMGVKDWKGINGRKLWRPRRETLYIQGTMDNIQQMQVFV
jgi:hypothetical protein